MRWPLAIVGSALAVFVAFLAASEAMIRILIEPQDYFEQHIDLFYRSTARNAVFGDSIPASAMILDDPTFVNLAIPSEGPNQTLIKIRSYFANKRPGQIVIGVNYNTIGRQTDDTRDYDSIFGMSERPFLRILEESKKELLGRYWQVLVLRRELRSKFRILPYGGYVLTDPERNKDYSRLSEPERLAQARREAMDTMNRSGDRSQRNFEYVRDILTFLTEQGGEVCLVTFPKSGDYRKMVAEFSVIRRTHNAFARLADDMRVRYINFSGALSDPHFYRNSDHLTMEAGRMFGQKVRNACFPTK